jgi:hypothetical protein
MCCLVRLKCQPWAVPQPVAFTNSSGSRLKEADSPNGKHLTLNVASKVGRIGEIAKACLIGDP